MKSRQQQDLLKNMGAKSSTQNCLFYSQAQDEWTQPPENEHKKTWDAPRFKQIVYRYHRYSKWFGKD